MKSKFKLTAILFTVRTRIIQLEKTYGQKTADEIRKANENGHPQFYGKTENVICSKSVAFTFKKSAT